MIPAFFQIRFPFFYLDVDLFALPFIISGKVIPRQPGAFIGTRGRWQAGGGGAGVGGIVGRAVLWLAVPASHALIDLG